MLAGMSAAAAISTAHDAIAVEATMARLLRSDARQPQQLPKCVDLHTCFDTLSSMSTLHCHPRISRRPKITTGGPWTTTTTSLIVSP